MSKYLKSLLWTAVPIVVLSVIGMAGMEGRVSGTGPVWWGAALYFVGAIIALIVYAIKRDIQRVAGILGGLVIGIISLGITFFAFADITS